MNAGAYGSEMKDIVKTITYMDKQGNTKTINGKDANFAYRYSKFKNSGEIILSAKLQLKKGNEQEIKERMEELRNLRISKQPVGFPSAGSTFKRGSDFVTAALIDEAGLKGYKIGGAQVSTKHAGFIINAGNATAKDILNLTEYIKKVIYE